MKTGFEAVAAYLPGERLNVREYYSYLQPEIAKLPPEEAKTLLETAPDTVHRLKDTSALEHMAVAAGERALMAAGLTPEDIDGLLVTQTGGKQFMPLLASYLQLNLGLKRGIIARNIDDNAVSALSMINLARIYVKSGIFRRVLLVAAGAQIGGKYGFGADLTEPWCMHLGDGAAAGVISAENLICTIEGFGFETRAVTARVTGTLNGDYGEVRPPRNRSLCFAAEMDDKYGAYLTAREPQLHKIAGEPDFLTKTLGRAAEASGLRLTDIDHILAAHLGDLYGVWTRDIERRGLSPDIFINRQRETGNTGCADNLIDLAYFVENGVIRAGELTALFAPCQGIQTASAFLRF